MHCPSMRHLCIDGRAPKPALQPSELLTLSIGAAVRRRRRDDLRFAGQPRNRYRVKTEALIVETANDS